MRIKSQAFSSQQNSVNLVSVQSITSPHSFKFVHPSTGSTSLRPPNAVESVYAEQGPALAFQKGSDGVVEDVFEARSP